MARPRARRAASKAAKARSPKRRAAKRTAAKAKRAARPKQVVTPAPAPALPANLLVTQLAEAAWEQADAALAQALADLDEVESALDPAERADALEMLAQSLAQAARRRGLTRVGALGVQAAFDPALHDLTIAVAKPPKHVHVRARGVARGPVILLRARAAPATVTPSRSTKPKGSAKRSSKRMRKSRG